MRWHSEQKRGNPGGALENRNGEKWSCCQKVLLIVVGSEAVTPQEEVLWERSG